MAKKARKESKVIAGSGDDLDGNILVESVSRDVATTDDEFDTSSVENGESGKKRSRDKKKVYKSDTKQATIAPVAVNGKAEWESFLAKHSGKLSLIQREEMRFDDSHIVLPDESTSIVPNPQFDNLSEFIKATLPTWKKQLDWRNKKNTAVLIISSSAIRVTHMLRALKPLNIKVNKLFAKHMKIEQQAEMLRKSPGPISIGTPNRIKALLDNESLSLDDTVLVIWDVQPDLKALNVLNNVATAGDSFDLYVEHLFPKISSGNLKVTFY